jgi:hypothetical protein
MKNIAIVSIFLLIGYVSFNYYKADREKRALRVSTTKDENLTLFNRENLELSYIIDVINNGSNRLNFKGGEMEGGFIPKEYSKDVACYLLSLRGKECKGGFKSEAKLFFSSNCAGCHGIDAKGIKNSYPNLLKEPLLGFQKWINEKGLKNPLTKD